MRQRNFLDYYSNQVPKRSQKLCSNNHINWWNFQKPKKMVLKAGFKIIYPSATQKSKFTEMRSIGWQTGFDSTHPELSFFVEAIK